MEKVFGGAVLIIYRWLVRSRLLTAKGDTEHRSPHRSELWRSTESSPKPPECKEKSQLSSFAQHTFPHRLAAANFLLLLCVDSQRLFPFLEHCLQKKNKIQIEATDQRQLRLDIGAKSSIPDFCFSSKGRHFLLWRNRSDSLTKRPQSREVLRLHNFFTHYTKVASCF